MRDLKEIGYKMKCVMVPALKEEASKRLKDCICFTTLHSFSHINRGLMGTVGSVSDAFDVINVLRAFSY